MSWIRVFAIVTAGALVGMLLGGLFGHGAGLLAPAIFAHLVPWTDVEPRGAAIVSGAIVGVLLGGGLASFAVLLETLSRWRRRETVERAR